MKSILIDKIHALRLNFVKAKLVLRGGGLGMLTGKVVKRAKQYVQNSHDTCVVQNRQYADWIKNVESKYLNAQYFKDKKKSLEVNPKFSIIFPVWNKETNVIREAIESILNQTYENWELCISEGSTKNIAETWKLLEFFQKKHPDKIKLVRLKDAPKINIIENSNNAISLASGDYCVFMDCDDILAENCLLELALTINDKPEAKFIYSDFDYVDMSGRRFNPSFWPDWSPHTILCQMYTTHVTCYERSILKALDGLRSGTEGAQDWDLVLRASEVLDQRKEMVHVPKILYHWRTYPESTSMYVGKAKEWAYEGQKKVLEDWVKRNNENAEVIPREDSINVRVKFEIKNRPKVSIIVPFKDKVEYLKRCVKSIETKTTYGNYELVLVDNQSQKPETKDYLSSVSERHRVVEYDKPYHFGKINTEVGRDTDCDHLVFLNNDTEVISEEWIEAMLEYSQREEVGAVGAKLLYPDNRIQHAGIVVGIQGAAGHAHRLLKSDLLGCNSWLVSVRNVLAVTGACMMIKKDLFGELDGFDYNLDPDYQDVDLGIRLYEAGYWNVYTPYAKLYHYEMATRLDREEGGGLKSYEKNARKLRKKWPKYFDSKEQGDPFYNANLTLEKEDFSLRV